MGELHNGVTKFLSYGPAMYSQWTQSRGWERQVDLYKFHRLTTWLTVYLQRTNQEAHIRSHCCWRSLSSVMDAWIQCFGQDCLRREVTADSQLFYRSDGTLSSIQVTRLRYQSILVDVSAVSSSVKSIKLKAKLVAGIPIQCVISKSAVLRQRLW